MNDDRAERHETRMPHLDTHTSARDLRQALKDKGFHAIHAKLTGEPNG